MNLTNLSDATSFEAIYRRYHAELYRYARKYVRDGTIAEEIVQELFLYLWAQAEHIQINTALDSYLYRAVKNRCLNYLARKFTETSEDESFLESVGPVSNATEDETRVKELQNIVNDGMAQLPEKCRIIFHLSRETGLSYQEIAQELSISVKTVEAQIGTALKRLRAYVTRFGYFLPWLLGLFFLV